MKSVSHDRQQALEGSPKRAQAAAQVPRPGAVQPVAPEPADLRPLQLFFLAAAVFVVSAGYGALLPLLPAWLSQQMPGLNGAEVARQVGFLSGALGLLIGMSGLAILALHRVGGWMYLGVSLTAAGTGLVLPVISFVAAGASRQKLGATMGGLAAAAGFGQTLGSAAGGWLFGALAQLSFAWLTLPLALTLLMLLARPGWWALRPVRGASGA